jgi:hypothetical protein
LHILSLKHTWETKPMTTPDAAPAKKPTNAVLISPPFL